MKILHVIPSLSPALGGPPVAAIGMARALAARGHEVTIYTTDADGTMPNAREMLGPGVLLEVFSAQPRFLERFRFSTPLLCRIAKTVANFDIIHLHYLYLFPTIAAGLFARIKHRKFIIRPCGSLDPRYISRSRIKKAVVNVLGHRLVMKNASAYHFTSELEKSAASPYIFGRPAFVVPNGIEAAEFNELPKRGNFRAKYGLSNKNVILFFGRISYIKGFEYLIPAFRQYSLRDPSAHLAVVGPDGGFQDDLCRMVAEQKLEDKVTITGLLTGGERLEALIDADLFVMPSYSENFGNALFEAMAAGLPVVVSDKVMTAHEVSSCGAGLVVEHDVERWAEALQLCANTDLKKQMGYRGRKFVTERYSWDYIAGLLERHYTGAPRDVGGPSRRNRAL